MFGDPQTWFALVDAVAAIASSSLRAQVEAGAQAVQVFDSWAGQLAPDDYRRFVLPASRRLFEGLEDLAVPRIHFGVGTGELLRLLAEAGADVIGVDWRVPLDRARRRLGPEVAVQGNLDPARCLAGAAVVEDGIRDVLARNGGKSGHIFNLGWGVHPETEPDILKRVVEVVHGH